MLSNASYCYVLFNLLTTFLGSQFMIKEHTL